MLKMGMTPDELRQYEARLAAPHGVTVELLVLDTDGKLKASIRPTANTAQVDLDISREVTRSATLTFNDPNRSLQFDSDSPNDSALYFDRMIQIRHVVDVPAMGRSLSCPVFTGPLVKFDRTGDEVSIEAQGKESLARRGGPALTIKRGHNAVEAIRTIMTDRVGETRFGFPSMRNRLPADVHVTWEEVKWPWPVCKRIARSLNLHLYYDGAGVCRLRELPQAPAFTFKSGDGGTVTSQVQVSHDLSTVRNRVHVVGSKPAHQDDAVLDVSNPLSPYRLRINGVQRYFTEEVSAPNIRSKAAAAARAKVLLQHYERMQFGTTFNAVPIPHLDERDLIRIDTDEHRGVDRLQQFSLALTGGDMTVGFNDMVALPRRRNRH